MIRLLDAEHIGVKSMSLSEATLDDVFLRQTGRSLRDAGSSADGLDGTDGLDGLDGEDMKERSA